MLEVSDMKKIQVLMVIAGLVLSGTVMALDWKVTRYDLVDKSLTTLLNEGWTIRNYTIDSGLGTGLSSRRSFILEKGGKYIECSMQANLGDGQGRTLCFSLS